MQDVNVNHVSGYPMISAHSTNKEVIQKIICHPMRYMVTLALTWLYVIYYPLLYMPLSMNVPHYRL